MKFNQTLNNFTAGEWSAKMLVNTELDSYKKACSLIQNMVVLREGGAFRRPGTGYINAGSTIQSLFDGATQLNMFPLASTTALGVRNQYVLITTNALASTGWRLYSISAGTFLSVSVSASADTFYDLADASYTTIGDELFIAQKSGRYMPIVAYATEAGCDVRTFTDRTTDPDYISVPYYTPNSLGTGTPTNMTASAASGVITVTASDVYFTSDMYGAYIRLTSAGSTGVIKLTAGATGTPGTTITGYVMAVTPTVACGTASGTSWEISAWNTYYGFPTKVTSFEQRIIFGGKNRNKPDSGTLWASEAGNITNMMEIPLAQDPGFTTYASNNARPFTVVPVAGSGPLQNLSATKVLILGYSDREVIARSINGIGPLDIILESNSSYGVSAVNGSAIDNNYVYAQTEKKSLRQLVFSYENEQYNSVDISFSHDITRAGEYTIQSINTVTLSGTQCLFIVIVNSTGTETKASLVSVDKQTSLSAWSSIILGGTNVKVRSVVSVPGYDGLLSELLLLVSRTINGATKVYLERLAPMYEKSTYSYTNTDFYQYMDSYVIVSSPGSTTISAPHLAGETVHVIADGNYVGTKVITAGGSLIVDEVYTKVIYGLGTTARLVPAPIQINTQSGNSAGMVKKVTSMYIKFWNTIGATYGDPERSEYYNIDFRPSTVIASTSIPLVTGEKRVQFPPGFSREKQVEVKSTLPLPCNVLAIITDGVAFD